MDPVSILENWLDPITSPLKEFRTHITSLANTHQSTLKSFNMSVNDLTNTGTHDPFTGPGADAMKMAASTFFDLERPMSDLLTETGPAEAIAASDLAVEEILEAALLAGGEVTDTGPLLAVTEVVDGAALLQVGLDPVNDGVAAGITAIEAAAIITILLQLAGTVLLVWLTWTGALDGLIARMNPPLPATPEPVAPPTNSQQERLREEVKSLLGNTPYNEADIDALINAGYTDPDVIAAIIRRGNLKVFKDPTVVRLLNTLTGDKQSAAIALLGNGIAATTVISLNENNADLPDIATNVQTLLDSKIRVKLINIWLTNGTNLNDAIAIVHQGVDLNLIGASSQVGDFSNIAGATVNEIVSRIPEHAKIQHWADDPGGAQEGMKFIWRDGENTSWQVRMHGIDGRAPAGSNAASGWVARVIHKDDYLGSDGIWYNKSIGNPRSPRYDPDAINKVHIPIQHP